MASPAGQRRSATLAAMRPRYEMGNVRVVGPPGWRALPPVTRATLVLTAAGYLLTLFVPAFAPIVVADPAGILGRAEVWRLLSYPLAITGIFNVLFGLLLFWSFGPELEPELGSRGYGLFLGTATAVAALLGAVAARLLLPGAASIVAGAGVSGVLTAVIVAWTLLGPHRPVHFFGLLPMNRRGFAILALVLVVFGELDMARLSPAPVPFALARLLFVLGGLPVAWFFARRWRGRGATWSPARLFRRRRFRVVRRDDDFPPTIH